MKSITWLHISDLHWRESNEYEATTVLQELLRDLANRSKIGNTLSRIDMVFATGDVAFSGRPEEYTLARRFFDDLLRTLGVPRSRLFLVPGNHDVDRGAISAEARELTKKLTDRPAVNGLLADEAERATVMKRLHRYQQFVNGFLNRDRHFDAAHYFYVHRLKIAGRQIAILGLNSAWRSESETDRTNLALGERQVRAAVEQATKADIRIALMHHPFEWLHDSDREACERLLLENCHFVLHGHLHRTGVMRLTGPDIDSPMVIAAGAAYSSNEAKACNLTHLDFDTGEGTVYLRLFSDKGGFWTEDTLSYRNAKGSYQFDLPRTWWDGTISKPSEPPRTALVAQTVIATAQTHRAETKRPTLDRWWKQRGYDGNPFICSNAGDVDSVELSTRFQTWYIDPSMPVQNRGLGPTPTLDQVIRQGSSSLVLVYAPAGGGKTFYRRWAAYQVNESAAGEGAVEVFNLRERLADPSLVTGHDLAACIYQSVSELKSDHFALPRDSTNVARGLPLSVSAPDSAPGDTSGKPERAESILRRCEELLVAIGNYRRVYVFVDDIAQLFGEQADRAESNDRMLVAVTDVCSAAAAHGGGERLALRFFLPVELQPRVRERMGEALLRRTHEHSIQWSSEHCEAVIEQRLSSFWLGSRGAESDASLRTDTAVTHLGRLLSEDTTGEFREWLRRQRNLSPRSLIDFFNKLGHFAFQNGTDASQVKSDTWQQFLAREEAGDNPAISVQEVKKSTNSLGPKLYQNLDKHFSEEDLRTLCFELGVDYESLPAQGKAGKARELILHLERHERIAELIDRCRKLRPKISWEDTRRGPHR